MLHAPENFIVGGGFFVRSTRLPYSLAWEAFEQKNGARTIDEMRRRIERYRRVSPSQEDYEIGCIVLSEPFFFKRSEWIPPPEDFSANAQTGKSYDLAQAPHGRQLWEEIALRTMAKDLQTPAVMAEEPLFGEPALHRPRLGQGGFRIMITDTYERHCAVTGEKILPVLQAAHIRPVTQGGTHRVDNGLLLRSDVHTLFDRGYMTVRPNYRLSVSRRLRQDFNTGAYYLQLDRRLVWVPSGDADRPAKEFLEWHSEEVFRA